MKKLILLFFIAQSAFALDCQELSQLVDENSSYYKSIYSEILEDELVYDEYMDAHRIHKLTKSKIAKICSCKEKIKSIDVKSKLYVEAYEWSLRNTFYYDEYMDHDIIEAAALERISYKCTNN